MQRTRQFIMNTFVCTVKSQWLPPFLRSPSTTQYSITNRQTHNNGISINLQVNFKTERKINKIIKLKIHSQTYINFLSEI